MKRKKQETVFWCYVTAANSRQAARIAKAVVEERLAACANILGPVTSVYRWKGRVERGREVALVLKTASGSIDRLIQRVRELHPYECPCIVALPISAGHPAFLDWVRNSVGRVASRSGD